MISQGLIQVKELISQAMANPSVLWEDYAYSEAVAGIQCLMDLRYECARGHFEEVVHFSGKLKDEFLIAYSMLGVARCARHQGEYGLAEKMAKDASEAAIRANSEELAAITKAIRAWCLYKSGDYGGAQTLFEQAAATLDPTDDWIAKGNMALALGRIERKSARSTTKEPLEWYGAAEKCYARALSPRRVRSYEARLQINTCRLLRLQGKQASLGKDRRAARRIHDDILNVRLPMAEQVYADHYPRGKGDALVVRGWINLDQGMAEEAAACAEEACKLARYREDRPDHVLAANALSLWARAEVAEAEWIDRDDDEQIAKRESHKRRVLEYGLLAVDHAKKAGNTPRLAADTYIALTLANHINNITTTRSYREAKKYAQRSSDEHVEIEFRALDGKLFGPLISGNDLTALVQELRDAISKETQAEDLRQIVVDVAIVHHWNCLETIRSNGKGATLGAVAKILKINAARVKKPLGERNLWPRGH